MGSEEHSLARQTLASEKQHPGEMMSSDICDSLWLLLISLSSIFPAMLYHCQDRRPRFLPCANATLWTRLLTINTKIASINYSRELVKNTAKNLFTERKLSCQRTTKGQWYFPLVDILWTSLVHRENWPGSVFSKPQRKYSLKCAPFAIIGNHFCEYLNNRRQ